jgi:RimJ/RimL family protein N-acetyltransferase
MIKNLSDLSAIQTRRLRLGSLKLDDAGELRNLTNDPAITSAVHILPSPFTLLDAEALINQSNGGRDIFIGAWTLEDDRLIGTVGAHMRGQNEIEIGYWIATAMQGRGFGSEAVRGVVILLAREFPESRIMAECRPENTVSWRLLERLGFRQTGRAGRRAGRQMLVLTDSNHPL